MSDITKIPKCKVPGCERKAQNVGKRKDGSIMYRKSKGLDICGFHHTLNYSKKNGYTSVTGLQAKRLQEAIDAGFKNRLDYNEAETLAKGKKLGFTTIEDYREYLKRQYSLTASKKKYLSFEALTEYKAASYFLSDKKAGKPNGYSSAREMAEALIKKVHENIKENSGVLRSEATGLVLNFNWKDILQLSFDREDNSLGHAAENVQLVEEVVNTLRKDKFSINQTKEWIVAAAESITA